MKVLFVDDEANVLEGLERMIFHLDNWEVSTALHADEALDTLRKTQDAPFDVVVTDMRMPGMDGAALLTRVSHEFPGVVRLVLSGHTEEDAAMRALPVAHQFLAKPCDSRQLISSIERACRLQSLLNRKEVIEAVCKVNNLPSSAHVYSKLRAMLNDLETTADDVVAVLSEDPAMCAKLLQLANSSFFSRPTKVSRVKQAVMRLGIKMVYNLVLTTEVFGSYPQDSITGLSVEETKRHGQRVARIARSILDETHSDEDVFVVAMLQDVGKLVLAAEMPREFRNVVELVGREEIPAYRAEAQLLGVTHAEVGAQLLALWGLPYRIVEAVAHHHNPMRLPHRVGMEITDAIYIADCLLQDESIDPELIEVLGIENEIEDWRRQAQSLAASEETQDEC